MNHDETPGKPFWVIFFFGFVVLAAFAGRTYWARTHTEESGEVRTVTIGTAVFRTEVARTSEEQQRGLGRRKELCRDCGMLFLFKKPDRYAFWMKDMEFSLDIVWISDYRIVSIDRNISKDDDRVFTPAQPVDMVLELNSGLADRFGFRKGDTVDVR